MNLTAQIAGSDENAITILRYDREQARIEIWDALAPRGEQILRTVTMIFPKQWHILGTDSCGNNIISVQLCSRD